MAGPGWALTHPCCESATRDWRRRQQAHFPAATLSVLPALHGSAWPASLSACCKKKRKKNVLPSSLPVPLSLSLSSLSLSLFLCLSLSFFSRQFASFCLHLYSSFFFFSLLFFLIFSCLVRWQTAAAAAMPTLKVDKCPTEDLAVTNRLILSPACGLPPGASIAALLPVLCREHFKLSLVFFFATTAFFFSLSLSLSLLFLHFASLVFSSLLSFFSSSFWLCS